MCTASWDYSDTDVFNCGSSFDSGDMNGNGIPDGEEDWDGDGIVNSKDPNPTHNDSIDPDSDNNGIPDKLDPFFNTYQDSIPEIIYCDSESSGCSSYNSVLRNLTANNKNLVNLVNSLSVNDMEAKFKTTLENLGSTIRYNSTVIDNKLTDVNSSLRQVRFAVEDNADLITDGFKDIADNFESLGSDITDINDTLYGVKNLAGMTYSNSRQIMSKIDNLSSNTPDVDLSGVENGMRQLGEEIKNGRDDYQYQTDSINDSIASLSNKIDGIEPTDLSGVETKLDDLIGGLTNDSPFTSPSSGFTGEGFLFSQNELSDLQEEVTEIKQEVTEEMDKFKTLFSIDTSSFNDGTFKEHSLNLRVNGSEQSFKSGVFTALLDNAAIISAVIMFLFVLSGIRMLGKD
ncbi:hypothetical protein ITG08_20480 [Vibrio cyclitrophicus]|nr:hypothetical protein ITG08_20480 [Vibrio cyclitrophicus]